MRGTFKKIRPRFKVDGITLFGLLPDEIEDFYARVNRAREQRKPRKIVLQSTIATVRACALTIP